MKLSFCRFRLLLTVNKMMEASTPIVNKNLRLNIENVTPFKRKSVVNVIPDFVVSTWWKLCAKRYFT